MKLLIREIGGLKLYGGVITEVRDGVGEFSGKVINIKLTGKEYDKTQKMEVDTTVEIAFWNSDDGTKMLADRAKKAKLAVGKFVTVLVRTSDTGKLSAVNFRYSGMYHFEAKEGQKEINVFIGSIGKVSEGEGRISTAIMANIDGNDTWCNLSFFNNEADETSGRRASNLADNAKTCFVEKNGKRPKVVVVAGEKKSFTGRDGQVRESYTAYSFDMLPKEAYNPAN